ncbi:hypothetical protein Tco_0480123, partial [Tanacetum coccineum]
THGLALVPSLEVAETAVDSLGTHGSLPVPSFELLVPSCLLLVFLFSLRAFIVSTASYSSRVKDRTLLSFLEGSEVTLPDCFLLVGSGTV